ncbi:hypothetical protein EDB86DRAFT_2825997 [Lactarius hatsudake]|nr:hypothetical protein EDB86DRAFT_2825997 [Lactarius hatsudake]
MSNKVVVHVQVLQAIISNLMNLQAAVGGLVADAMKCPDNLRGIIYGVAFSIFHCIIASQLWLVLVAIQMLKSYRGLLGPCSHVLLIKPITRMDVVMGHERGVLEPPGGGCIGQLLPQEIWEHIALEPYDPIDLLMLAWFSAGCKYRLVQAWGLDSPNKVDNMGNKEDKYNDGTCSHLYSARFKVISNTVHGIMDLGSYKEPRQHNLEMNQMMLPIHKFDCMRPIPYTIQIDVGNKGNILVNI